MKVTWAASHYPPDGADSGSAESVRLAAEALAARGHEVRIVAPNWGPGPPDCETIAGVLVLRFGRDLPAGQTERAYLNARWLINAVGATALAARGADLIHAQDRRMLLPSLIAGRLRGLPVALTLRDVGFLCPVCVCLHGRAQVPADCGQRKLARECGPRFRDLLSPGLRLGPLRWRLGLRYAWLAYERWLSRHLALVGFVSDALRRTYASAGWPPPGVRTAVLYSPVSEELPTEIRALRFRHFPLAPTLGLPWVLFAGKPSAGKGWPAYREAASGLHYRAVFMQAGPRPAEPGTVACLGPLSRSSLAGWMREAAVVCVPSVQQDSLPRVAMEAACQERVVVGSPQGGIPEIIEHGETGWILPIGGHRLDALALETGIEMVLDDPGRAEKMGRQARAHVLGKFGPGPTTDRLVAAYEEVLR